MKRNPVLGADQRVRQREVTGVRAVRARPAKQQVRLAGKRGGGERLRDLVRDPGRPWWASSARTAAHGSQPGWPSASRAANSDTLFDQTVDEPLPSGGPVHVREQLHALRVAEQHPRGCRRRPRPPPCSADAPPGRLRAARTHPGPGGRPGADTPSTRRTGRRDRRGGCPRSPRQGRRRGRGRAGDDVLAQPVADEDREFFEGEVGGAVAAVSSARRRRSSCPCLSRGRGRERGGCRLVHSRSFSRSWRHSRRMSLVMRTSRLNLTKTSSSGT